MYRKGTLDVMGFVSIAKTVNVMSRVSTRNTSSRLTPASSKMVGGIAIPSRNHIDCQCLLKELKKASI